MARSKLANTEENSPICINFFDDHYDLHVLFPHLLPQNAVFHLEDGLVAQIAKVQSLRRHCLVLQRLQILKFQNLSELSAILKKYVHTCDVTARVT